MSAGTGVGDCVGEVVADEDRSGGAGEDVAAEGMPDSAGGGVAGELVLLGDREARYGTPIVAPSTEAIMSGRADMN